MATKARQQVKQREPAPRGKAESLFTTIKAMVLFGLVGLGIIGLAITLFGENGIAEDLVDRLFDPKSSVSIVSLVVPVILFLLLAYIIKGQIQRNSKKSLAEVVGSMALYAMMLVGLYYLYRLLTVGTFT
ncbi:MAG: hypothetical protein LBE24_04740 [Methylobacillus sp.]|nr:hypothetical protein [Methylobacillus sp.]